jgi:hypothetical protein
MNKRIFAAVAAAFLIVPLALATQADNTTIQVASQEAGPTPFIRNLTLSATNLDALKAVQFTIAPKTGSVTRPLSALYSKAYLLQRGYVDAANNRVIVPVFGLYDNYVNSVSLTYFFADDSSKPDAVRIQTAAFNDQCDFNTPNVVKPRSSTTELSYDFILVTSNCSTHSPTILDTDGAVRWVGTAGVANHATRLYDNAIYIASGTSLLRTELDGQVTLVADYANIGVVGFTHNIDLGKSGMIADVDTTAYVESENIEVDVAGKVLNRWNMGEIIRAEMTSGGDDPDQFIKRAKDNYDFGSPEDWWHNNSVAYRASDNTLIISSRENFVIAIDYDTHAIKWILGDKTKKWYQFPSLRKYALATAPGTLAPVGQHSVSITHDDYLLLMDNGRPSQLQQPPGPSRPTQSRKYKLDLDAKVATQVWAYPETAPISTPFCSSIYEDAPFNYLIDYAQVAGRTAEILGVTPSGEKVFDYSYPTGACEDAYRSLPLHLERTVFVGGSGIEKPGTKLQLANISSRCFIRGGNDVAIAGFIVTGNDPRQVVVRALGPSLADANQNSPAVLNDPTLELHAGNGDLIEFNNNWGDGPEVQAIGDAGLIPPDNRESAILRTLAPGKYTAVVRGLDRSQGISLVEAYDVTPTTDFTLGNLSARAFVSTGDDVLIGGLIVRGSFPNNVLFRAIGPSLVAAGVSDALADTTLDLYNSDGAVIASNDNWAEAGNADEIGATGIPPNDPRESAILTPVLPGKYTAIVRGKDQTTGTALVEVYNLGK